jgi:hypothetical protein
MQSLLIPRSSNKSTGAQPRACTLRLCDSWLAKWDVLCDVLCGLSHRWVIDECGVVADLPELANQCQDCGAINRCRRLQHGLHALLCFQHGSIGSQLRLRRSNENDIL